MNIGNIELGDRPLFLAPMEDVTDASFRFICKEFGADMMYTEFISSDGLIRDARKSLEKLVTYDYEAPIGIQIYGNIPEAMVDAAVMAERAAEIAGGHGADLVDINFGCPVNKIARRGAGSGMMREPDKMVEITRQVVEAVKLPVTGFKDNSGTCGEVAGCRNTGSDHPRTHPLPDVYRRGRLDPHRKGKGKPAHAYTYYR